MLNVQLTFLAQTIRFTHILTGPIESEEYGLHFPCDWYQLAYICLKVEAGF